MLPDPSDNVPVERSRRSLSTSDSKPPIDPKRVDSQDAVNKIEQRATLQRSGSEVSFQCLPCCQDEYGSKSSTSRPLTTSQLSSIRTRFGVPSVPPTSQHDRQTLEPPVTKGTLSELDVAKVIANPKLRHDINFDPDLHFRPNVDGEKGKRKQEKANQFWTALKEELTQFTVDPVQFVQTHGASDTWCLPSLFRAVRQIIQTLVPQKDGPPLEEALNVELLMQQLYKGVLDLEKLAAWLSQVLKSHCAPMRDEWVDAMYQQLSVGNSSGDLGMLVNGMRSLLSVLEAMKLDVANHQIRCLRAALIIDTTNFEQKFFYKKLIAGKLDISSARPWYESAKQPAYWSSTAHLKKIFGDSAVFFMALSRAVLPAQPMSQMPNTFLFDDERILKLRYDVYDAFNLEMLMEVYDHCIRVSNRSLRVRPKQSDDDFSRFKASLGVDLDTSTSPPSSRPSSLALSSSGSVESHGSASTQSGLDVPSYLALDAEDSLAKSQTVRQSLIALIRTAPPFQRNQARWEAIAPHAAAEICRHIGVSTQNLQIVESFILRNLSDTQSSDYFQMEGKFHTRLMGELAMRVADFRNLSSLAMFTEATKGQTPTTASHRPGSSSSFSSSMRDDSWMENLAMRIAHLGTLHWRCWGPIAYVPAEPSSDVTMT